MVAEVGPENNAAVAGGVILRRKECSMESRPVVLSDRQGFDRRWFAPNLQAVFAPTHPEHVADCLTAAINAYGRDVKIASGRHCYENFVYNSTTRAVIDMSALNQVGFDPARNAFF